MNGREAIRLGLDMAEFVSLAYLQDLAPADLLHRPCPGANHIAWQLGHLIVAEHELIEKVCPGRMPALPAGFAGRYTKETCTSDNPADFHSSDEFLAAYRTQRAGTLSALNALTDADLDAASGVDYAPNVGGIFSMQGSHWLMHAGQWAVIRRQMGRPPLF